MTDTKTCTKCGETKPLDEFNRNRQSKDGLFSHCKVCRASYRRSRRAEISQYNADYARIHSDKLRGYRAARYSAQRDASLAYAKEYYLRNRGKVNAYDKRYREQNPHVWWRNRYRQRAIASGFHPVIEDFTKPDVIERYGDSCSYCEAGPFENLDHFIPVKAGGPHTLENVRPACFSCNRAKSDLDPDEWLAEQAELDGLTEAELDAAIDAEIDRWTE